MPRSAGVAAEPTDFAFSAEGLAKSYGGREAVRGIDLAVRRGEFFGLLGPNGAGKTTTIGMLAGLIEPTRGRITVLGRNGRTRSAELKRRIGLVPQDLAFYSSLSARDNLLFFGEIFGLSGKPLRARIDAVLAIAGLDGRDRDPVTQFSGGMKRRLNIAIGLLHEPDILILDEPTVGVDAQSRNAILEALQQLNRAGITIVYSTHYMEEAQRLCGRVAILDHGRVIALGSPSELISGLGAGLIEVDFGGALTDACRSALQPLGELRGGDPDRPVLGIQAAQPETVLPALFETARLHGLSIRGLRLPEPNLEAVFLKLTGRQLRD